jgi:hypothetical protein
MVIKKGNIRYDAKSMILHDSGSRYSGEEALLHTPLKADYGYFWRRLPGQSKTGMGKKGYIDQFDVYLHLSDSKPGRENAMKITISRVTRTLMNLFHTKWSCLGRTRSPAYPQ